MPALTVVILAIAVFLTAAISGLFGMAGGMILMVVLLSLMPVPAAMTIHATIQAVSNGWRCWLWRRHIVWRALPYYMMGVTTGFAIVASISFVPEKSVALIAMGLLPLLSLAVRRWFSLNIINRFHAFGAAAILTVIQMTAGVVGPLLDVLYNNAPLTRQQIVSTKAFTQTTMHILRLIYYGIFVPSAVAGFSWPDGIGGLHMALFIAASVGGTSAAAVILKRMDDATFKRASSYIIAAIGTYCIIYGLYLEFVMAP